MLLSLLSIILATLIGFVNVFSNMGVRAESPGRPAWDQAYYSAHVPLRLMPRFEITFDPPLQEAFADLALASGFDVEGVVNSFPDIFYFHRWLVRAFPGLFYSWADNWMAKGDAAEAAGEYAKMGAYRIFGSSVAMPVRAHFEAVPLENAPHEYEIWLCMIYADGSTRKIDGNFVYNEETGAIGAGDGISGLGFNFHFNYLDGNGAYAYTTHNPFMRVLGYSKLYDVLLLQTSAMVNVDTVRLKFPYAGKNWMLQLWKGRYFITTGGEVGIYNKPASRWIDFYDAATDSERIEMSFKISHKETGAVFVDRPLTLHWWMTGFAVQERLYTPDKVTLETEIVPIDEPMKLALVGALEREASKNALSYTETAEGHLLITW